MANELSRVGDRLARTREQLRSGGASVWITPPARREPGRPALPDDLSQGGRSERDSSDEQGRRQPEAPATVVAIHVEVRHPQAHAPARIVDAHVDADVDEPAGQEQVSEHSFSVGVVPEAQRSFDALALPKLHARAGGVAGSSTSATETESRASAVPLYLAERARAAYRAQRGFIPAAFRELRLLDLRV